MQSTARESNLFAQQQQQGDAATWRVTPLKQPCAAPSRLRRLFHRPAPTTYQRCLAVHLYFAEPHRGLS